MPTLFDPINVGALRLPNLYRHGAAGPCPRLRREPGACRIRPANHGRSGPLRSRGYEANPCQRKN